MKKILLSASVFFVLATTVYANHNQTNYIDVLHNFLSTLEQVANSLDNDKTQFTFFEQRIQKFILIKNDTQKIIPLLEKDTLSQIEISELESRIENISKVLCNTLGLPSETIINRMEDYRTSIADDCLAIFEFSMITMMVGTALGELGLMFLDIFPIFGVVWLSIGLVIGVIGLFLSPIAIICTPFFIFV